MTKIKELLSNREKLAKYDELAEWKKNFVGDTPHIAQSVFFAESPIIRYGTTMVEIPDHIKQIIVSALEAEIKKLDEE